LRCVHIRFILTLTNIAELNSTGGYVTPTTSPAAASATTTVLEVNGTTLAVERRGAGPALLLIHGGGEDASMLAPQAQSLALAGFDVISYDRRGTGRSGRDDWPSGTAAADQHAADAAALLEALDICRATVLGVSSGGVIALRLGARHREAVRRVVAWEPPVVGLIPGGAEMAAALMRPVHAHLAACPHDFAGAQAILLSVILGHPVDATDPAFGPTRRNAEAMVRDEPGITLASFTAGELAEMDVTIAVGSDPNEIIRAAADELGRLTGTDPVHVHGDHEVYLSDPSVLTGLVHP
jgi:pimeloyl-ACP methyl ester carboxylesterase